MTVFSVRKITVWMTAVFSLFVLLGCGQEVENKSTDDTGGDGKVATPQPEVEDRLPDPGQPQRAVVAETLAYAEINDNLVKGHFAFPQDMIESYPAIILIHEWWGLNDQVRALANRIAAEGFVVLAIDLYEGQAAATPPEARKLMTNVLEHREFAALNIQLACDWVRATAGAEQVGVVGYGLGGGWSLNAAIELPDRIDAAVMFYGQVSGSEETLTPINVPILGFFGADDSTIPVASVAEFEEALQTLRKDYDINIYPGARNGFASSGNRHFDSDLAAKSWEVMSKFLHRHLDKPDAT